jgi:heme exporter protein CcmD
MDHTPFIVAAYAVTLLATGGLLGASWVRMRRAERAIGEDRR